MAIPIHSSQAKADGHHSNPFQAFQNYSVLVMPCEQIVRITHWGPWYLNTYRPMHPAGHIRCTLGNAQNKQVLSLVFRPPLSQVCNSIPVPMAKVHIWCSRTGFSGWLEKDIPEIGGSIGRIGFLHWGSVARPRRSHAPNAWPVVWMVRHNYTVSKINCIKL